MGVEAIVTHGLFAAAGAAGHWCIQVLRQRFEDKAFRDLYHLPLRPESTVNVVCPSQSSQHGENVPTTYEDSAAQAVAQAALLRRRLEPRLMLHNASELDRTQNLFLVCGPVGNSVTQALLDISNLPFHFKQIEGSWKIVDRLHNIAHPDPPAQHTDYGIAAALKNPWSAEDSRIWMAAGIHGLGTLGAARVMTERIDLLRRTSANKSLSASFAAVIEAKHRQAGLPEVVVLRFEHL